MSAEPAAPSFSGLFTPKLVTVLREGYGLAAFRADAVAGLTVAVVALPLSMAIAIGSGVTPDRGLFAAIIGGFIVSALGGSRFQIGGPAGAFIVLVAATAARHGIEGLLLSTFLSGAMLSLPWLLRLGTFIKYIPYPVTVGFTAGIGVIIFASQLKELGGLTLAGPEPGPIFPKLEALAGAAGSASPAAMAVAGLTILLIILFRRYRPQWPGLLIALAVAAGAAALFHLPVDTIGSRYGGIPSTLPSPQLPDLTLSRILAVFPDAVSFTLLGAIESLLSAVVADSMTGRRHRSNCELVAQGIANMASAVFGGICVTGTIARTATNVRAGAHGPVSGMLHAVYVLVLMLAAAPLAAYLPLAALAGVLATVAWNMIEKHQIWTLLRATRGDATVLLATFGMTVFRDLSEGIMVGVSLAAVLVLHRMAQTVQVHQPSPLIEADRADEDQDDGGRSPYDASGAMDRDILVYRISGAFFFGAAANVAAALERIGAQPKVYIVDFSAVPMLDTTAGATLDGFVTKALSRGARVYFTATRPDVRHILRVHHLRPPRVIFTASIAEAKAAAKAPRAG